MIHDHEAIVARVGRLETAEPTDVDTLQELLYGLHALITVHFGKEEDLQLPAFDAAPDVAADVLQRMAASSGHAH
jgi:hypothetical protein